MSESSLSVIGEARRALASVTSFTDVLEIRDKAEAIRIYMRASKASLEAQNAAADIRLRAERKAGEMLADMEMNVGSKKTKAGGNTMLPPEKLSDIGITKMQSSRWQAIARVPEAKYEELVAVCQEEGCELTQSALLSLEKQLRDKPVKVSFKCDTASGVYRESIWSFVKADCRSLPFPDDHFDLVFCSPPYESQRSYEELEFSLSGDEYVQWAADCFMECLRVCSGLVAWVVEGSTESFEYSYTPFLIGAEVQKRGGKLRKPVVYQRNGIPGTGGPDWLRNDWEPIICATKNGRLPWSNNTAMGKPPKQNTPRTATNRNRNGDRKSVTYIDPEIANPGNVIKGLVGSGAMGWSDCHKNEAPFPEWLPEFFIQSFCKPGGRVLDPFSGSGTTVSVAVRNSRDAVGVDLRESQLWLGETRVMGLTVSERLSGQQTLC